MKNAGMIAVCSSALLLGACLKGDKGDPGPQGPEGLQGPLPTISTGGGLTGTGALSSPLAVMFGTGANTAAPGNHSHYLAGGASASIVTSIVVNAKADCGGISPPPHMDVYVNGDLIGGVDVTNSAYADSAVFAVNPAMYASEIAVAYTNDNQNGGCDHNIYVDHVTLTTAAGPITLLANDLRNVIIDKGQGTAIFDNLDVAAADNLLDVNGALRFFIAPAPLHAPRGIITGNVQSPGWNYSLTGPVSGWTALWSGAINVPNASTLFVSATGHWAIGASWCYATILIDGTPLAGAACSSAFDHGCSGAPHTYTTNWEPLSTSGFVQVAPGSHVLALAVVPASGATCSVNGARIYYAAIPK